MTAQALLLEAVPSLKKNHDLLMEMLMRPDDFTLAALGCSVRAFLEKNGVDITLDPQRIARGGVDAYILPRKGRRDNDQEGTGSPPGAGAAVGE